MLSRQYILTLEQYTEQENVKVKRWIFTGVPHLCE